MVQRLARIAAGKTLDEFPEGVEAQAEAIAALGDQQEPLVLALGVRHRRPFKTDSRSPLSIGKFSTAHDKAAFLTWFHREMPSF